MQCASITRSRQRDLVAANTYLHKPTHNELVKEEQVQSLIKSRTIAGTVGAHASCCLKYCKNCIVQVTFCNACWKSGEWVRFKKEADCELAQERKMHEQFRAALNRQIEVLESQKLDVQHDALAKDREASESRKMAVVVQRSAELDLEKRRQAEAELASALRELQQYKTELEEASVNQSVALQRHSRVQAQLQAKLDEAEQQLGVSQSEASQLRDELMSLRRESAVEQERMRVHCVNEVAKAERAMEQASAESAELLQQWREDQRTQEKAEAELLKSLDIAHDEKDAIVKKFQSMKNELESMERSHRAELAAREERHEEELATVRQRLEEACEDANRRAKEQRTRTALAEDACQSLEYQAKLDAEKIKELKSEVQVLQDRLHQEMHIEADLSQRVTRLNATLLAKEEEVLDLEGHVVAGERERDLERHARERERKQLEEEVAAERRRAREATAAALLLDSQRSRESRSPPPSSRVRPRTPQREVIVDLDSDSDTDTRMPRPPAPPATRSTRAASPFRTRGSPARSVSPARATSPFRRAASPQRSSAPQHHHLVSQRLLERTKQQLAASKRAANALKMKRLSPGHGAPLSPSSQDSYQSNAASPPLTARRLTEHTSPDALNVSSPEGLVVRELERQLEEEREASKQRQHRLERDLASVVLRLRAKDRERARSAYT